jgi:hypothetical protein
MSEGGVPKVSFVHLWRNSFRIWRINIRDISRYLKLIIAANCACDVKDTRGPGMRTAMEKEASSKRIRIWGSRAHAVFCFSNASDVQFFPSPIESLSIGLMN